MIDELVQPASPIKTIARIVCCIIRPLKRGTTKEQALVYGYVPNNIHRQSIAPVYCINLVPQINAPD